MAVPSRLRVGEEDATHPCRAGGSSWFAGYHDGVGSGKSLTMGDKLGVETTRNVGNDVARAAGTTTTTTQGESVLVEETQGTSKMSSLQAELRRLFSR